MLKSLFIFILNCILTNDFDFLKTFFKKKFINFFFTFYDKIFNLFNDFEIFYNNLISLYKLIIKLIRAYIITFNNVLNIIRILNLFIIY